MTTDLFEVSRRLECLADVPVPTPDAEAKDAARARVVARLSALLDEPRPPPSLGFSRRLWLRVGAGLGGVLAVAAGVALFVGSRHAPSSSDAVAALVEVHGAVVCAARGESDWKPCDPDGRRTERWRTLSGARAVLRTPEGIAVAMDADTQLQMGAMGRSAVSNHVAIESGRATFRVPRLAEGHVFAVRAPELTVVVHGTEFSVAVRRRPDGLAKSCVEVTEGVVSVTGPEGERQLRAKTSYGCEVRAEKTGESPKAPTVEEASPAPKPSVSGLKANPAGSSQERSTLVMEARMLQMALGAERQGDLVLAEKRLNALLTQYPRSVVVPEAQAALARVQERRRSQSR